MIPKHFVFVQLFSSAYNVSFNVHLKVIEACIFMSNDFAIYIPYIFEITSTLSAIDPILLVNYASNDGRAIKFAVLKSRNYSRCSVCTKITFIDHVLLTYLSIFFFISRHCSDDISFDWSEQ